MVTDPVMLPLASAVPSAVCAVWAPGAMVVAVGDVVVLLDVEVEPATIVEVVEVVEVADGLVVVVTPTIVDVVVVGCGFVAPCG
jgi:hypothetical protein